ncbi:hypothetical protein EYF80_009001 [Liparis tanakae]|uniref:Secreted protein n=1 Tax=Liparis tanakae TaxID=230148 RepID=A0A4Z2ISM2_9TELE|nr:hypothetical protein EYF80_009001 [Liparis tanakae]
MKMRLARAVIIVACVRAPPIRAGLPGYTPRKSDMSYPLTQTRQLQWPRLVSPQETFRDREPTRTNSACSLGTDKGSTASQL